MAMSTSWVQKIAILSSSRKTVIERYADAGEQRACCLPSPRCPAVPGPQDDNSIRIVRLEERREARTVALFGLR